MVTKQNKESGAAQPPQYTLAEKWE